MSETTTLTIPAPNFKTITVEIEGTAPYMQARFSAKAMQAMKSKMEAGSTAASRKKRKARDFKADFKEAQYISTGGWNGMPASAFRNASIRACKTVGFHMTNARMSIFIEAEGLDATDGTPLVKIIADPPEMSEMAVRNATGVADIRVRPMWREWKAILKVTFDRDQFTEQDVINLLMRAGMQVGVGEGRPFSKKSNGLGFGLFKVNGFTNGV